jgi:site-specific recombinase XerD
MPLNLYRRHLRIQGKCVGGHTPDSRNYEPEELRRGWKKCHCPIYADGTLGGLFKRRNTKKATWPEAKAVLTAWESVGTWDGPCQSLTPSESSVPSATEEPKQYAVTIQLATDAYLSNRAGRGIAPATVRKYKTFVNQLLTFVADKGYVMIDQIQITDMDEFYSRWKDGIRAKGKKLERLNGFFKFCVKRKWIGDNPAADLEAPVGAGTAANRMPFTDAELVRVYEACDRLRDVDWKNHLGSGSWGGDDVKSMVMLLSWTGLRISDAATFDMNRVTPHPDGGANVFLRMHKTKGPLFTWVGDWLYERLLARERKYGSRIFACGMSERLETATDLWRRRINRVFDLAGAFECGTPTPHIFRHTFVRLLLQHGVSPRDVADLIGDTEEVVVKHYARWVPERQERLTNILRKRLSTAPKPKLTVIRSDKSRKRG